ncbi:MAG: hypothetical protein JZU70_05545 [Chlorobium sp.]|nr:hypothetical protein [Chlorobium sp.]
MQPIRINNYCFDRIHTWIQYDLRIPQFVEVVIEVFYPFKRDAEGLVMFNHGFMIGYDPLYYLRKLASTVLEENPLFAINPSNFYNYTTAIVENNWAMAYVAASKIQPGLPWTDVGGNPRVGQAAFAAASYLVKYGATDYFFKGDEHNRDGIFFDQEVVEQARILKPGHNNVIFAGHSVGGAHAQAAACGFEALQELGEKTNCHFNPVMYDREVIPARAKRMAHWQAEDLANPVGLIQLSPVDQQMQLIAPGMEPYRSALAKKEMPIVMIVGDSDQACLSDSNPPAWSSDTLKKTQFTQLSPKGSNSWAVVANVAKGSHTGYLTEDNELCNLADEKARKSDPSIYKAGGEESLFTAELFKKFIATCSGAGGFNGNLSDWIKSDCISWLNRRNPCGKLNLVPFSDGSYIDYASKPSLRKP